MIWGWICDDAANILLNWRLSRNDLRRKPRVTTYGVFATEMKLSVVAGDVKVLLLGDHSFPWYQMKLLQRRLKRHQSCIFWTFPELLLTRLKLALRTRRRLCNPQKTPLMSIRNL